MGTVVSLPDRRGEARLTESAWRHSLTSGLRQAYRLERQSAVPSLAVLTTLASLVEEAHIAEAELRSLRGPEGAA